jgi:flagellar biogenesis protein FliO
MSAVGGTSEVLSVVFSLLIIMAFLFAAACLARRWRVGGRLRGPRGGATINIVAAQPMGWQSSLHIVEAEGQRFLIAASRSGIAAIGRLDAQGPDFADLLDGPGGRDAHSRSKP